MTFLCLRDLSDKHPTGVLALDTMPMSLGQCPPVSPTVRSQTLCSPLREGHRDGPCEDTVRGDHLMVPKGGPSGVGGWSSPTAGYGYITLSLKPSFGVYVSEWGGYRDGVLQ